MQPFIVRVVRRGVSRIVLPLALALAVVARPAHAQSPGTSAINTGTVFTVVPYAGYMLFGNYLNGPFGTSLTNAPGPIYGAQIGMAIAPSLSVIGNLGRASGDLRVGLPIFGGFSVGSSSMLLYDGALQLDLPFAKESGMALRPFIQAGVGGIQYDINASVLHTTATNAVAILGGGADVTVARGMALRLMVKDYIGKFDFQEATSIDVSSETAHNFAFSAGLRFDF